MSTLFTHFLFNVETLTWLTPLSMCRHSCTHTPCAHMCEEGRAAHVRCAHTCLGEHWLRYNPWQVPRTSDEPTSTVTCTGFQDVAPFPQGRFSFLETPVGIPGGWLGGPGYWSRGGEEAPDGGSLTQDPEQQGQSPAVSLQAASQDRQAPPVAYHYHSLNGSPTAWRWECVCGGGGAGFPT